MNKLSNIFEKSYNLKILFLCCHLLLKGVLGLSGVTEPIRTLVVGGIEINHQDVPWLAQIRFRDRELCGAAILNQEWLLSAAHCFPGLRTVLYTVELGRQNKDGAESKIVIRNVSKIITHPNYGKAKRFDSDVSLIKLMKKVPLNSLIKAVTIQSDKKAGQIDLYCCLAGWGDTLGQGKDGALNQVCLTTYDTQKCNSSQIYGGQITDNMFCAGFDEGGVDSCQGDSGGPLLCNRASKWVLEGVTSFGQGCGTKPGVYTKISQFSNWITSTIAKN